MEAGTGLDQPPLVWMHKKTISSTVHSVKLLPDVLTMRLKFGLFCQVPFPSKDAVWSEPWSMDAARSLLENDAIAFKTLDSVDNFLKFCKDVLRLDVNQNNLVVKYKKRRIKVCTIPIALPFDRYEKLLKVFLMDLKIPPFETSFILRADLLTVEGVERMIKRFTEFGKLITIEPNIRGLVTFLQVFLTRDESLMAEHQGALEEAAWRVNRRFERTKWTPIVVLYGNPERPDVKPFYKELEYMASFGLEERGIEMEFLLFDTKIEQTRYLLFSPFVGVVHQMKEASLRVFKQADITDVLFKMVEGDKPITLIMDFDGTLVPTSRGEVEEELSEETRRIIAELALHPRIHIIISSGREPADVARIVNVGNIMYIGNHGYSIIYPDGTSWTNPLKKEFNKVLELVEELYSEVCEHGAYVVNHGSSLVFHYRHVLPVYHKRLYTKAWRIAASRGFRASKWMRKLEIRLPNAIGKGEACLKAVEHLFGKCWKEETHIIYIGDSESDETAMRALSTETGISGLRVTEGRFPKTIADVKLPSTDSVLVVLRWLLDKVPESQPYALPSYYSYVIQ